MMPFSKRLAVEFQIGGASWAKAESSESTLERLDLAMAKVLREAMLLPEPAAEFPRTAGSR